MSVWFSRYGNNKKINDLRNKNVTAVQLFNRPLSVIENVLMKKLQCFYYTSLYTTDPSLYSKYVFIRLYAREKHSKNDR